MRLKKLLKSKTFWGGLAGICTGLSMISEGATAEGVTLIIISLEAIFVKDGQVKLEEKVTA